MVIREVETNCTIFNVTLAKNTGLYQMLDPGSIKLKNHNACNVVHVVLVLFSLLMASMLSINGVNLWTKYPVHRTDTVLNVVYAEMVLFTCYKVCVIMYRSHDILDCFPITRFDFTSLGRRHTHLLELWRDRSIRYTNLYAYTTYISGFFYVICPLWFGNKLSKLTAADGSTSFYRINVLNLYTFFSDETYNTNFFSIYLIEMGITITFMYFFVIFDTLLAELCLSLVCQLQIINSALESLGKETRSDHRNSNNIDDRTESKMTDKQYTAYDEFISIIKDHQVVIKKFDKILSIFGGLVLSQICVSSCTVVVIWFTIIKKFTGENVKLDTRSKTTIAELLISCPALIFQLFMACYLFELINNEKESIIFSLYSSNWTEMNMNCKKLVLMTMIMNNAHRKKLKFSPLRVVNLIMFLGTMRIVYSVLSVMLKV